MFGNFKDMMDDPQLNEKWREEFGPTFKFKWLFNYHLSESAVYPQQCSYVIDIFSGLRHMMLGVIGKAGFNHDVDALDANGRPSELNEVPAGTPRPTCTVDDPYSEIAGIIHTLRPSALLTNSGSQLAPWRAHRNAWAKMDGIASQIVMERKANAKLEGLDDKRDLMTYSDTQKSQLHRRTRNDEVLSSIYIIVLGTLFGALLVASRLRGHHFHVPAMFTQRMAREDDVVPLPKPYIDYGGKVPPIPKGQMIHIPILAVNNRPERWESLPDAPCSSRLFVNSSSKRRFRRAVFGTLQPDSLRLAHPPFMVHIVSLFAEFPFDSGSGPAIVASTT
ncbi:hypothetical protein B0H14DRAFT_2558021 [Mycena olivaceomarginata]|nr:hypothetical protein B0H14DRAFT_2558021 [Mycena olivaceomarginata]